MDGNHIVISCLIKDSSSIYTHALINCGATGYAFFDVNLGLSNF